MKGTSEEGTRRGVDGGREEASGGGIERGRERAREELLTNIAVRSRESWRTLDGFVTLSVGTWHAGIVVNFYESFYNYKYTVVLIVFTFTLIL